MEMMILVLAALVVVTTVATVGLAGSRAHRHDDPDATFWYVFTGLCVLAPMLLIPAMTSRVLSGALVLLAAGTAIATHVVCRRTADIAALTSHRAELAAAVTAIAQRHQNLIAQWSRYELDPGAAIDFPTMSDVSVPQTSALIRAINAATRLQQRAVEALDLGTFGPGTRVQGTGCPAVMDDGVADYQRAVSELAAALKTAEDSARRYQRG
ncbi:hypothetical protein [Arthrobacter alpinus]|nr:hypothetical protein [Arthrobacter alpinus]